MGTARERSIGEIVNTWLQNVAILGAAVWVLFTYVYEKFMVPQAAPANVTVTLDLANGAAGAVTQRAASGPLTPIEMRFTATNPNTRVIDLLPTAWFAYGCKIGPGGGLTGDSSARAEVTKENARRL